MDCFIDTENSALFFLYECGGRGVWGVDKALQDWPSYPEWRGQVCCILMPLRNRRN